MVKTRSQTPLSLHKELSDCQERISLRPCPQSILTSGGIGTDAKLYTILRAQQSYIHNTPSTAESYTQYTIYSVTGPNLCRNESNEQWGRHDGWRRLVRWLDTSWKLPPLRWRWFNVLSTWNLNVRFEWILFSRVELIWCWGWRLFSTPKFQLRYKLSTHLTFSRWHDPK